MALRPVNIYSPMTWRTSFPVSSRAYLNIRGRQEGAGILLIGNVVCLAAQDHSSANTVAVTEEAKTSAPAAKRALTKPKIEPAKSLPEMEEQVTPLPHASFEAHDNSEIYEENKLGDKHFLKVGYAATITSRSASQEPGHLPTQRKYRSHPQNVDLPPILPKNKKKPYPVPLRKMQRAAKKDKKLAEMGIEKPLEPPKNGLLVPELVPVAYEVLEYWKVLIRGLSQLMDIVTIYGCSKCSEVHVGPTGHLIQDCHGTGSERRKSYHSWVKGSINDVLIPIDSYHLFDPFGRRIRHETRLEYDRIPAVVELCIQAGVDLPEYPSRRRTTPVRMLGRKIIDRGGDVEEPKPWRSGDSMSLLAELDTYRAQLGPLPLQASDIRKLAERTLKAYSTVRRGVRQLMKKYTVKACGYCSEVHVGPWGHNVKLCGAFKHQWRDGKHGWQDATLDEVIPPNYVYHLRDPDGPPLRTPLKRYYGKAPAVVEVCVQAGAQIPDSYRPMMRLDIVVPDSEEARAVA